MHKNNKQPSECSKMNTKKKVNVEFVYYVNQYICMTYIVIVV